MREREKKKHPSSSSSPWSSDETEYVSDLRKYIAATCQVNMPQCYTPGYTSRARDAARKGGGAEAARSHVNPGDPLRARASHPVAGQRQQQRSFLHFRQFFIHNVCVRQTETRSGPCQIV